MSSKFVFESRDNRIERMAHENPGRPIELCTAVVDGIWENKRKMIFEHVPERFKNASISDLGYLGDEVKTAIDKVFEPIGGNNVVGVIFSGPTGSGKTHAAYATIKWLADKNPEIIPCTLSYPGVIQDLRYEFTSNVYLELGSTWDRLNNNSGLYDGIIFLDDIASQKPTDFELDKLMMFFERRINEYLPFLITTNVAPSDFKSVFGERITSRLIGSTEIIEFSGQDKRIKLDE